MKDTNNVHASLNKLDDMVDAMEKKLHDIVGLFELICLGMEAISREDDSYELSSLNILREYLYNMKKTDVSRIRVILEELKKEI